LLIHYLLQDRKRMPSESNSFWLIAYKYSLIVLFILDTLGFCLMSYLIIKQSKGMQRYKWYLLVNFTLSYAFSAFSVLFEPIPLFNNVLAVYFDGLLKNFGFQGVLLAIGIYCSIAAALPFTMLYRFLQVCRVKFLQPKKDPECLNYT
jgi:hypothetical protein